MDGDGNTVEHGHYFKDIGSTNPAFSYSSSYSWSRFRTIFEGGDFTFDLKRRKVRYGPPPSCVSNIISVYFFASAVACSLSSLLVDFQPFLDHRLLLACSFDMSTWHSYVDPVAMCVVSRGVRDIRLD